MPEQHNVRGGAPAPADLWVREDVGCGAGRDVFPKPKSQLFVGVGHQLAPELQGKEQR